MFSFKIATALATMLLAAQFSPLLAQDAPLVQPQREAVSDLLIILDADGRSHTAQHTVSTDFPTLKLTLPGSVIPQQIVFFGNDANGASELHKQNPNVLELRNGGAFARYQHQYGVEVQQTSNDQFALRTPSIPHNIELTDSAFTQITTTWIFPNQFELISYSASRPSAGTWSSYDNTLSFNQSSKYSVELLINFRLNEPTPDTTVATCTQAQSKDDDCLEDADQDGIPDTQDICLSENKKQVNEFGCDSTQNTPLSAVVFDVGRTYLNVHARQMLDTVASVLLENEDRYYEIGAHTDNAGGASSNQRLSKKRADAVRHYLILKGVDPNSLTAVGYGEQYPIRDNSNKDGRRANRRVELSPRR